MKTSKKRNDTALSIAKLYILMTLGLILVTLPLVSLALDPVFLIMKYMTRIAVGTTFYNRMLQENMGARIELYIFNITNSAAFLSGEDHILKLEEVGPFNYQEFRMNKDFELDEDEEVMRYTPHTRTEFLELSSIGDPRSINVTVPNISFLSLSSMFSSYPFWTKTAFNVIASQLRSQPIVNLNVHDYLWGYNDPLIALSHTLLPGWIHFKSIGILDRLYDQSAVPLLEVSTKNEDKFQVRSINGYKGLNMLGYEDVNKRSRCNTLEDTYEGYAFAPGMTKDDRIRLYRSIFCRMLDFELVTTSSNEVSPLEFVYDVSNTSYSINPNNECLCPNKDLCTDGASTMAPCLYGLGIGLSNAHFLHADAKIYERVEGMNPNQEKHGSRIVVDPKVGALLSMRFMIQVNVLMEDVSFNLKVKPFTKMTVPLAYFKIISEASEDVRKDIRAVHNLYPYIIHTVEIIVFLVGLVILAYVACQISDRFYLRSSTTGFKDRNITRSNHVHNLQEKPLVDGKTKSFRPGLF